MRAITDRIGHFLVTNTVWIFVTTIIFVSFHRIMILLDTGTRESFVYLTNEKWALFFQFTGSLLLLFLPVLLFSFYRIVLRKSLNQWLYKLIWLYCFLLHPYLFFYYNLDHVLFPPLRVHADTPAIFGMVILGVELIIQFNDFLVGRLNIVKRFNGIKLEHALFGIVLIAALYWTYATADGYNLMTGVISFGKWLLLFAMCYLFYWLNHYLLIEKIFKHKGIFYYLFAFAGLAMVFFPIFVFLINLVWFQKWIQSGFSVIPYNIIWTGMLYSIPIILVYQWWKQKNDITTLEKEKSATELNALKQQINPHFLFNTLNSLYALGIEEKSDKTADGIAKLGTLMRYNLNDAQKEFIPLSQEIDYINKYIELQELRLTKNNQLSVNFLGELADKQIAPLLLIPFIENSFKFGVSSTEQTKIDLTITLEKEVLKMHLYNTIIKNRQTTEGNGIGISNTRKRLAHLYPSQYELIIEETPDDFEVHLDIKLA